MQKREIIFGAPGCGKTTHLLNILEKELKETTPNKIAFVSFTRKGVNEGLKRAMEKFDYNEKDFHYFRTIHSICFRELNTSRYDMLGKKDYKLFSQAMNMKFIGYYTEEFFHNDDQYLFLYFLKHNNYEMYTKMRDAMDVNIKTLKHVASNYNNYKKQFGKVDFTDLLKHTLEQGKPLDIDVAIIDEAQDLTTLQWKVANMLFSKAKKVYIAGDDDQAIYEWTGADVNYFLNAEGHRTILDKSWRLQSNLLNFAKQLSGLIETRVDKDFKPFKDGGNIAYYNSIRDFEFNDNEKYYCLARNNYYLKNYTEELKKQHKLFTYKGKASVDEDVIWAINNFNDYKSGLLSEQDKLKVSKFIKKDVQQISRFAWFEVFDLKPEDSFYYRKLIEHKVKIEKPKIHINTVHGVKGGEADNVILLMDITKSIHDKLYDLSDSELRVLYVACTRAKNSLHIIHSQTKYSYSQLFKEATGEYNF